MKYSLVVLFIYSSHKTKINSKLSFLLPQQHNLNGCCEMIWNAAEHFISADSELYSREDFIKCSSGKNTPFSARHNPSPPSVLQSVLLFLLIISLCLSFAFLLCLSLNLTVFKNPFCLSTSSYFPFFKFSLLLLSVVFCPHLKGKPFSFFLKQEDMDLCEKKLPKCQLMKRSVWVCVCIYIFIYEYIFVCLCHLPVYVSPRHRALD